MPKLNLKDAFATYGLRASFQGMSARVMPVNARNVEELDIDNFPRKADVGQMILAWKDEDGKNNGDIIFPAAKNDLSILIKRNDGTDFAIRATSMTDAVISVLETSKRAMEDRVRVAEVNAQARRDYEAAIGRGETPEEPEDVVAEFAENAFEAAAPFIECVKDAMAEARQDTFVDIAAKAKIDSFMSRVRDLTRDELTASEKAKVDEARSLRAELAILAPAHVDAAASVLPKPYDGDREAAATIFEKLPVDPDGISAAQRSALKVDPSLATRLFSVATSTPAMAVQARPLSHTGFASVAQMLAKHENKEAGEAILPRMAAVTKDAMPTYDWRGKIYTKDGADVLLMRDEYAAFVYAWDSESRVMDLNVEDTVLKGYTKADVPTDEALEALRKERDDARYDVGGDIDFDWDEEDPEDDVDFDMIND